MKVHNNFLDFLKVNWFKLLIAIAILILVIGLGLYLKGLNDLAEQNRTDNQAEQLKDYVMKQKQNCLDIYQAEAKKYNNVDTWSYDSTYDDCLVNYKQSFPKTIKQCNADYGLTDFLTGTTTAVTKIKAQAGEDLVACMDGDFINRF